MPVGTSGLRRGEGIRSSVPTGIAGVGGGMREEVVARQRELNEILEMQDWTVACDHLGKFEGICELCGQNAALGAYDPWHTLPEGL